VKPVRVLLVAAALLAACSGAGQSLTPAPLGPGALAVEASLTAAAASLAPTSTVEPSPALGTQPSPAPVETAPPLGPDTCQHDLIFLTDLTVPDGTVLAAGQSFDKRWQVQNTGSCAWGPEFRIVLVAGDAMNAPTELALFPALPGADGMVRALMTAPQAPGDYSGTWQARDPQGNLFGNEMWVRISVAGE
jgi:hypothetical protein